VFGKNNCVFYKLQFQRVFGLLFGGLYIRQNTVEIFVYAKHNCFYKAGARGYRNLLNIILRAAVLSAMPFVVFIV
jgi:hypothetical protein